MIDRRAFLSQAAAVPLVFGLADLFSQEPGRPPGWFSEALRRMKETGRYGIVLVVPDAEAERRALGGRLQGLIDSGHRDVQHLLCEAVFICMTSALTASRLRAAGENVDRILLNPDGKRVEADVAPPGALAGTAAFIESFRKLLYGEGEKRRREHVASIEARLPAPVKDAIPRFEADDFEEREKAWDVVRRHAEPIVPYLVYLASHGKGVELRDRCSRAVLSHFAASREGASGPRLPYGCAAALETVDPCPACGRGVIPHPSQRFLRFLTQ